MKKQILLFATFMCVLNFANAQWVQTSLDNGRNKALALKWDSFFATIDSAVFVSFNGGSSWSSTVLIDPITSLAINGNYIFVGTGGIFGGVYMSVNNGSTWTYKGLLHNTICSLVTKEDTIFAGLGSCGVEISTNNGISWAMTNVTIPDVLAFAL